jgi:hypothetical protein
VFNDSPPGRWSGGGIATASLEAFKHTNSVLKLRRCGSLELWFKTPEVEGGDGLSVDACTFCRLDWRFSSCFAEERLNSASITEDRNFLRKLSPS